jgi:hypothetical protein
MYLVPFENVSVSAAQDLWEISPADDRPVRIWGWTLANVGGVSDVGDAAEETLRLSIVRGHTTSGSGGSTPTISPVHQVGAATAGFAAEVNNTTIASTAGTTIAAGFPFNVRVGGDYLFPPEFTPYASQANTTIVVRLVAAPADAVAMSGTLYVEEV